jgi:signal transduction histidine kinase
MTIEINSAGAVDTSGQLAAVILPVALVVALVVALATPLTWFILTCLDLETQAGNQATQIAAEMRQFTEESPALWMYNSPKVAGHFRTRELGGAPVFTEITDNQGHVAYQFNPEQGPYLWHQAPIMAAGAPAGYVQVGISLRSLLLTGLILLAIFAVVGFMLSGFLYLVPLRTVRHAEASLLLTLNELDVAQIELQKSNVNLETRVEEKTTGLREAHALLQEQQDRLQKLAASTFADQEEDRVRIARDLHDSAGQMLTAVRLDLENVLQAAGTDRSCLLVLEHAVGLVDQTTATIRQTIRVLGTPLLGQGGLERAVRNMVATFQHGRCTIDLQVSMVIDEIPAVLESCAFRVIQESTTNAIQHGRAENIRISINGGECDIAVEVEDDGCGRDGNRREGFGLKTMLDRVELLGGKVFFGSAEDGNGTLVRVILPVMQQPPGGQT